jgi:hypothetical protein
MEIWIGCVAGVLGDADYVKKLANSGFREIDIQSTRVHSIVEARSFLLREGVDVDSVASQIDGEFISAFIRAAKPR